MLAQDDPALNDPKPADDAGLGGGLSMFLAADLQDSLMVAGNDLERLQRLLDDAGQALMVHFYGASAALRRLHPGADDHELHEATPELKAAALTKAVEHMAGAITAMQFQDMSTQLIAHTSRRLRNCVDRIARDSMGDDEDGVAVVDDRPLQPNPVTQDEVDAGSIELF
jgi:hypothetical protein